MKSSLNPPHPRHHLDELLGTHSATHSRTLPTKSKAATSDLQLAREPVRLLSVEYVLQSCGPGLHPADEPLAFHLWHRHDRHQPPIRGWSTAAP